MPVQTFETPPVNHLKSTFTTPVKSIPEVLDARTPDTVVNSSFSSSCSNDSASSGSVSSSDTNELDNLNDKVKSLSISDHKRLELEGKHLPEPLLSENSGRFVLFPIQHADVSVESPVHTN